MYIREGFRVDLISVPFQRKLLPEQNVGDGNGTQNTIRISLFLPYIFVEELCST